MMQLNDIFGRPRTCILPGPAAHLLVLNSGRGENLASHTLSTFQTEAHDMKRSLLITVCILLWSCLAHSQPVEWPVSEGGNGHYYQLDPSFRTWTEANSFANSEVWIGLNGHLVTITSVEESDWIFATIGPPAGFWTGGFQPPDAPEPDGDWRWVTGEPWAYTNWAASEPNDFLGNQDAVSCEPNGLWYDNNIDAKTLIFIIEFDEGAVPTKTSTWGHIKALYR